MANPGRPKNPVIEVEKKTPFTASVNKCQNKENNFFNRGEIPCHIRFYNSDVARLVECSICKQVFNVVEADYSNMPIYVPVKLTDS